MNTTQPPPLFDSLPVFATFSNGSAKLERNFKLLPDNYIQVKDNDPAPIEDYGDYMLCPKEVTEDEAFEAFTSATISKGKIVSDSI